MSRPSKARRFGLTKDQHPFAPLHPNAKDSRASRASATRPEPGIEDVPQSSSEDESPDESRRHSPQRTVGNRSQWRSPASSELSTRSPLPFTKGSQNVKRTYGKPKVSKFVNIHKTSKAAASAKQKSGPRGDSPAASSDDHSNEPKAAKPAVRKSFQAPPPLSEKPKPSFRLPVSLANDLDTETKNLAFVEAAEAGAVDSRRKTKARAVFKTSKSFGVAAQTLLGDDHADLQQLVISNDIEASISSAGSGSLPATLSTPHITSSLTSTSELEGVSFDPIVSETYEQNENVCPICKAPVDEEQLDLLRFSISAQKHRERTIVSEQTEFCRRHREAEARKTWSDKGYPEIDWPNLPERFHEHRQSLDSLLQGTRRSFYRQRLQEQVDAHCNDSKPVRETILQKFQRDADSAEDVGYYGGKGAALCMEFIANEFASRLQELRAQDPLIAACGGVASYEQLVLLPELCSLLVVDDRRARQAAIQSGRRKKWKSVPGSMPSEEELAAARETLRESAELGRLICEEENEEVQVTDDEDE